MRRYLHTLTDRLNVSRDSRPGQVGHRFRHPRGMTVMELMIVLVVISILVTLTTPLLMRSQRRAEARSLATDISQQLRVARNKSMSRGEAIWVDIELAGGASRGQLRFRRTKPMCDNGTVAATCPGGRPPRRARNCRMGPPATSDYDLVGTYRINTRSGDAELKGANPAVNSICFSPDGRSFDGDGVVIAGGSVPCSGESLALWIAGPDISNADAETAATCGADPETRELGNVFVVRVPYNGAVEMKQ